ncbi:hypothetical protein GSY69_06050 [Brevibacterium sp. 5221]|uniref:Uncharacterized protein n=1 Tax=Brevibacterium rongguiense TaxID=2695267 RepID=A0A6N9H7L6_9MICO|nr:hypothetical protein [Brevibacterium rongguiense]MYM19542.1 hypothetical protein [Brevibacterium rongguiense]
MTGIFQGTPPDPSELLQLSLAVPDTDGPTGTSYLVSTVTDAARDARTLAEEGEGPEIMWRFAVMQALDTYRSLLRGGGVELAAQFFTPVPPATGAVEIDAAFAVLAAWLAERDGWTPPAWVFDPARTTARWYADLPVAFMRAEADAESPAAFASRGVYTSTAGLSRA